MISTGKQGKILIIDSDDNIIKLLRYNLCTEGFSVGFSHEAYTVHTEDLKDTRLVIVDAMEQNFSGLDFIGAIRKNHDLNKMPIILCAEPQAEDLAITALNNGADDFVVKPFSLRELLARVNALLRRYPLTPAASNTPRVSDEINIHRLNLRIDTSNRRVIKSGEVLPLTKTEFAILVFLIKNSNNFYTRDQIFEEIWSNDKKANPRIVDTNISRIRKKLGDASSIIINRYGLGYSFTDK